MAKIQLGDWGTYYHYSNTNTPSEGLDWETRWSIKYEQDIANNRTNVYVTPYLRIVSDGGASANINASISTTINGTTKTQTITKSSAGYSPGTTYQYGTEQSFVINHNSDGTASCQFSGYMLCNSVRRNASHTYSLPTINVASTITSDAHTTPKDFGQVVTFTITRPNASVTHKLSYLLNGTWTVMAENVGSGSSDLTLTYQYTFPTSLISSVPNNEQVYIMVKCESSNGTSDGVGSYINVPAAYVPTISLALSDIGTVPSNWGIYVKGKSKLRGVITAAGAGGSTISSYAATANNQSFSATPFETTELNTVGSNVITASVVDSRGRTASTSQTKTVYDYSTPTYVKTEVIRCDNNGTENNDGTYGKVVCQYSISPCNNRNTKSLVVTYGNTSKTFTLSNYSGTITASTSQLFSGLATTANHTFTFKLIDSFNPNGILQTYVMPPSFVLESKHAGGKGITFGQIATEDGFHVYMDAQFHSTLKDNGGNIITAPSNGKLTIQKNGTTVKTFTANQSSNVTANITVPTKTSELTNDSGFLTGLTVTQIRNSTTYNTSDVTYTGGIGNYKLLIILGKVASSNGGYSISIMPTELITTSGIKALLADEVNWVNPQLTKSGNDLKLKHTGRSSDGYVQYIYGVK